MLSIRLQRFHGKKTVILIGVRFLMLVMLFIAFLFQAFQQKKEFEYQVDQFKSGNLDILQFKRWVLSLNQELEEELTVYEGRLYEADGELSAETVKLYGTFLISSRANRFDNTLKQIARLPCFENLVYELFKWMATI